ncbi:hypothetical protein FISHEDRAFT_68792 [Fistulina hepatica ATCC 64428]|uniref:Uncharacterized protein n=1 Tax=Fistulina hepatica ATCC 64428 TaxID=1128425 RepID=A0A0D7AP85_9AGAR|nr:hypothetical protein FISHEDRAFT_68792 [Fistulina hepatica ATCC 64428]
MRSAVVFSLSLVASVYGHAFINTVTGANGVSGYGLGVLKSSTDVETDDDGSFLDSFLNTPVLNNVDEEPCGATISGGSVDIASAMADVSDDMGGVPTIPEDGNLELSMYEVDGDGGGPFTAEINEDATGSTWTPIDVTTQPAGTDSINLDTPSNNTIAVTIPSTTTCTGGTSADTCLIRFSNSAAAGPFGGCVAVAQSSSNSTRRGL